MECTQYYEMTGMENIYLEDSYVLDFLESADCLIFKLDVVLTENHSLYQAPKPNEHYYYKKASLEFHSVSRVVWIERHFRKSTDAAGETDFGNIDAFYVSDGTYHLEGDWGIIEIQSAMPILHFDKGTDLNAKNTKILNR